MKLTHLIYFVIASYTASLTSPPSKTEEQIANESRLSDFIKWHGSEDYISLDHMKPLLRTSKILKADVQHLLDKKQNAVWHSIDISCSSRVFAHVSSKTNETELKQYYDVSRELHLRFDHLFEIESEMSFRQCVNAIIKAENSLFVENIWFHLSADSNNHLDKSRFQQLFDIWKSTGLHYFVFNVPQEWWNEFIEKTKFEVFFTISASPKDNRLPFFISKLRPFINHSQSPTVNVIFSIPQKGTMDKVEKVFGSSTVNWAIPYWQWDDLPAILTRSQANVLVPTQIFPNKLKKSFIEAAGEGPFYTGWLISSRQATQKKPEVLRTIRTLLQRNIDSDNWEISVPKDFYKTNVVQGTNEVFPIASELDSLLDGVPANSISCLPLQLEYNGNTRSFHKLTLSLVYPRVLDSNFELKLGIDDSSADNYEEFYDSFE